MYGFEDLSMGSPRLWVTETRMKGWLGYTLCDNVKDGSATRPAKAQAAALANDGRGKADHYHGQAWSLLEHFARGGTYRLSR